MSGLEIAGVLLGAFPLLVSGIEHWHNVAKVGGYFWRIRKEYKKCRSDVTYHQILYKRNLRALLSPVVSEADDLKQLIEDPDDSGWKDVELQARLELRLQESYKVYMDIVVQLQETAEELNRELCFDHTVLQNKLNPPKESMRCSPSPKNSSRALVSKATLNYQMFRVKFSLREATRDDLFEQLQRCNDRLEKLLATSNQIPDLRKLSLNSPEQVSVVETALKVVHKKAGALFKALQAAWNCSCLKYHFVNLRLEHRTLSETYFEVILMYNAPAITPIIPWSWKELQCGDMNFCTSEKNNSTLPTQSHSTQSYIQPITNGPEIAARSRKVAFAPDMVSKVPTITVEKAVNPVIHLCRLLEGPGGRNCIGVIRHDCEVYHLHPLTARRERDPHSSLTLNEVLSPGHNGELSRRQRYTIALILASSIAQLDSTPWLRTELSKQDILFFPNAADGAIDFNAPFIQKGFLPHIDFNSDAGERNFFSLGILLLELCFGKRLEDEPLRKRQPIGDAESKQAFDIMAALKWSKGVDGEGGDDYAVAVRWCFAPAYNPNKSWRKDLIKNVIRPLEACQAHFRSLSTV